MNYSLFSFQYYTYVNIETPLNGKNKSRELDDASTRSFDIINKVQMAPFSEMRILDRITENRLFKDG